MDPIIICPRCAHGLTWADTDHCHDCEVEILRFRARSRRWIKGAK